MKSEIRKNFLNDLRLLSESEKTRRSVLIQNQLKQIMNTESGSWVAFKALNDEPILNWNEISSQIDWSFPKITNDSMSFFSGSTEFSKSPLGFQEPQDGKSLKISDINGFVVPGVAFDKKGNRLGRGKGYYDRSLQNFNGKKIGVCFELSLCEELPHEDHDILCTQIVTEYQVVEVKGDSQWN